MFGVTCTPCRVEQGLARSRPNIQSAPTYTAAMDLTRSIAKTVSRVLIGAVLFTQLAVASYACPRLTKLMALSGTSPSTLSSPSASTSASAVMTSNALNGPTAMAPDCDQMDPNAPNLCAEHCRQGQQSVDTAAAPVVSLGMPILLYPLPSELAQSVGSDRSASAIDALDADMKPAPEPPHAILHCVFRI